MCSFNKCKVKVCVNRSRQQLGTSMPSAPHQTLPLILSISCSGSNAESRKSGCQGSLKGAVSVQKVLQGSQTETREVLGGMEEKIVS